MNKVPLLEDKSSGETPDNQIVLKKNGTEEKKFVLPTKSVKIKPKRLASMLKPTKFPYKNIFDSAKIQSSPKLNVSLQKPIKNVSEPSEKSLSQNIIRNAPQPSGKTPKSNARSPSLIFAPSITSAACEKIMCDANVTSKKEATQWLLKHHPDKGGEHTDISISDMTDCMSKKVFCVKKSLKSNGSAGKINTRKVQNSVNRSLNSVFKRAQFKSPTKTVKTVAEPHYKQNAKQLECVRQVSNWSKIGPLNRFDKRRFSIEQTDKLIPIASPKLEAMLQNIEALDKNDMLVHGKKFKHFIFSDIKLMGYGSKIIAAAMIARGWKNILKVQIRKTKRGNPKPYIAIDVPKGTNGRNFAVLSSTPMWESPFSHALKKDVLRLYNSRPDNIYGEECRLIVLDSGFKEGIDLFDVRYVHLFEPLMTAADQTQAMGRATRLCGQKGLDFVPNVGWPLHIFKYSQSIPELLQANFKAKNMFEIMLQLKGLDTRLHRITKSIHDMSILAAVDQPLTEEIHKSGLLPHIQIKSERATRGESMELVRTEEKSEMSDVAYTRPDFLDSEAKDEVVSLKAESVADLDEDKDDPCAPIDPTRCSKLSVVPFAPSRLSQRTVLPTIVSENNILILYQPLEPPKPSKGIPTTWFELRRYVVEKFADEMSWDKLDVVNKCAASGGAKKGVPHVDTVKGVVRGTKVLGTLKAKPKAGIAKPVTVKAKMGVAKANPVKGLAKANPVKGLAEANPVKGLAKAKAVTVKAKPKVNTEAKTLKSVKSTGIHIPSKRAKLPALKLIEYTPTQNFISSYFTIRSPIKGMLLWHSVGTGKTCTAIALASRQFEPAGYTILWVTRHTLKADIWKNIFEQVCHATIADEVRKGKLRPQDVENRQRQMFDNWVQPMSYRQFSNLVTARNPLYKVLVERNGKEDPLRKTLIVIDEAHKLYSSDFKGAEKPDVGAFMNALQKSYKVSGENSARVLLMTATPYNESPIEMMKLLNLCRPNEKWLPETIPEFLEKYMDEKGNFTKPGLHKYMDDVAGQISYLNREADPSQFAQPVFSEIVVPISTYDMDNSNSNEILIAILEDIKEIDSEYVDLDNNVIPFLKEQIALIEPSLESRVRECEKTHTKPKDVKECIKRVEKTYKAGLKLENKNLKEANKMLEKLVINKRNLERRYKSTSVKMRKMSLSQQAQFEGRCKIGADVT